MFYNRDLSWLGFNLRVLQEASDEDVPLFERMKFLAIFSSNLDEFFRVRYPAVVAFSRLDRKTRMMANPGSSEDFPEKIQNEINRQLDIFGSILTKEIIPALLENGIYFYYQQEIKAVHLPEVKEIFLSQVLSFIQPLYLDANISSNFLPENNQLYLIVSLKEPGGLLLKHAVVNIPSGNLKRFFVLEQTG